jgi:hypothetical protein
MLSIEKGTRKRDRLARRPRWSRIGKRKRQVTS